MKKIDWSKPIVPVKARMMSARYLGDDFSGYGDNPERMYGVLLTYGPGTKGVGAVDEFGRGWDGEPLVKNAPVVHTVDVWVGLNTDGYVVASASPFTSSSVYWIGTTKVSIKIEEGKFEQ